MPLIPDNARVSLTLVGSMNAQEILLTHVYEVASTFGAGTWDMIPNFNEFIGGIVAVGGLANVYLDVMSDEFSLNRIDLQVIYPTRYVKVSFADGSGPGTVVQNAEPPNVAHAILLRTDLAGRDQRATKHIGGVPSTFTNNGRMTAAAIAAYEILADQLVQRYTVAGTGDTLWWPIIYHRDNPGATDYITSRTLQNTTRVERRRTVGLGS